MSQTIDRISSLLREADIGDEPTQTSAQEHLREFRLECEQILLHQYYVGRYRDVEQLQAETVERIEHARGRLLERLLNLLKEAEE